MSGFCQECDRCTTLQRQATKSVQHVIVSGFCQECDRCTTLQRQATKSVQHVIVSGFCQECDRCTTLQRQATKSVQHVIVSGFCQECDRCTTLQRQATKNAISQEVECTCCILAQGKKTATPTMCMAVQNKALTTRGKHNGNKSALASEHNLHTAIMS